MGIEFSGSRCEAASRVFSGLGFGREGNGEGDETAELMSLSGHAQIETGMDAR